MAGVHEKRSVLIVDDNSLFAEMLTTMLTDLGHAVVSCTNPHQALKIFSEEEERFDVVIVDENMPDMTGIELTKKLLQIKKSLPVILLTGYGNRLSMEQLRSGGFRKVLLKPLLKYDLQAVLEKAVYHS